MYTYYTIKLYFTDGSSCYLAWTMNGTGDYECVTDLNNATFYDSYDEARNYYYSHIRGKLSHSGGKVVDWSRSTIVSVNSREPL